MKQIKLISTWKFHSFFQLQQIMFYIYYVLNLQRMKSTSVIILKVQSMTKHHHSYKLIDPETSSILQCSHLPSSNTNLTPDTLCPVRLPFSAAILKPCNENQPNFHFLKFFLQHYTLFIKLIWTNTFPFYRCM